MTSKNYQVTIKGQNENECKQKMQALARLGSQFSGKELTALATRGPQLLQNPITSGIVRKHLGL